MCGCINIGLGSVLSRSRGLILRLFLLSAISLPTLCVAKEPSITIYLDPKLLDQNMTTVWYGYLLARVKYREDHKLPIPESGAISPVLDEEVYARTLAVQIYQEMKDENKGLRENYWETLSQIKSKGFMNAYVWTYLHQASWPTGQQPENLSAFQVWSRSNLKNHQATTYGSLAVER